MAAAGRRAEAAARPGRSCRAVAAAVAERRVVPRTDRAVEAAVEAGAVEAAELALQW